MMGFFVQLRLRIIVFFLRFMHRLTAKRPQAHPDFVLQIPSRDAGRSIKAHVYRPADPQNPSPVLLNFHGSGFVLPLHGSDNFYCRRISKEAPFTVLDIQYRLSPENPFPAPLYDVEDVVKYIKSSPTDNNHGITYDTNCICISGFSAGGNLALASSSMILPPNTFRSVIAFYPPADLATPPDAKSPPEPSNKQIPAWMAKVFDGSYFQDRDAHDPRISPFYAPAENFPDNVLIVTAGQDYLADEAAALAEGIKKEARDKHVVSLRVEGCGHAWDKNIGEEDSHRAKKRDEAYAAAVEMLKRSIS
uniref:AB hydrolase superfamily protein n=1 Tax=Talaromyces marneffei PM1 TaxID=1077442 RepID=A0A093VE25_TALMA